MNINEFINIIIHNGTLLRLFLTVLSLTLGIAFQGIKILRMIFTVIAIALLVYTVFRLNPNFLQEAQGFFSDALSMFGIFAAYIFFGRVHRGTRHLH